jgi:hypothetical protein
MPQRLLLPPPRRLLPRKEINRPSLARPNRAKRIPRAPVALVAALLPSEAVVDSAVAAAAVFLAEPEAFLVARAVLEAAARTKTTS